jgi:hypothetical protein
MSEKTNVCTCSCGCKCPASEGADYCAPCYAEIHEPHGFIGGYDEFGRPY